MTTARQHPIGTPFTAASTARDVLTGLDLTGRNVVITGGAGGLGREATRALSEAGASVTVTARDPGRAAATLAGIERVEVGELDLLDPASIDAFARRYLATGRPLHVLINCAGNAYGQRTLDARGYEAGFAAFHLGHFQLTLALHPALRAAHGARVVNVSSGAHRTSDIRWDDPHFARGYDGNLAYGQTKTAAVLFAVELDRRWAGEGIRAFSVHPGISVASNLAHLEQGTFTMRQLQAMGLVDENERPIIDPEHEKKTPEQAAATIVFGAASPLLDGIGGVYLKNSDVAPLDPTPWGPTPVGEEPVVLSDAAPHALDPASARRLWELSEELLTG
ncbi:SDR family NAD(P)-dependent oxidoreductase [Catenuloplanes atrovinosus]|uniref:NAD(P)-dependent dehydrogenase (Short-subunit alcohol dehydrogenase family) n=1 Tax=Catenuloplanes atrovinosus TaxID=137266 RepID=A0AAE3YYH6_9ACTN|nr:SDR family NAD(P)-dependent oxidoreductase [Catenuloplanes atrovinosus]MDR7280915.1 NAD(P)-dependent dehydrogenase (short-subunit alcohol dehydrogenase family) [Catenuloplanes atrovinosus]